MRGPIKAEALVRRLLEAKADIMAALAAEAKRERESANQLFDARQMQGGTKDSAFRQVALSIGCAGGKTDIEAALNQPGELWVPNFVPIPAGENHAKGREGTACEHFLDRLNHVPSLSRPSAEIKPEAEAVGPWPGQWRERTVVRRGRAVRILERIDPPQQFPWLSEVEFDDLPAPWR